MTAHGPHGGGPAPEHVSGRRARLLTATDARPRDSMHNTLTTTRRDRSLKRLESLRRRAPGASFAPGVSTYVRSTISFTS